MKHFAKRVCAFVTLMCVIALSFSVFTACEGQRTLKEISVDLTSVKTEYFVGDPLELSTIKVNLKYNDDTVEVKGYNDIDCIYDGSKLVEGDTTVTSSAGSKQITVKYEGKTSTFTLQVISKEGEKGYIVTSYEQSENYNKFVAQTEVAGTAEYGDDGYEGQFFAEEKYDFVVGNDNNFKYLPKLTMFDDEDNLVVPETFSSVTEVTLEGQTPVKLTAKKVEDENSTQFYDGEKLIVTSYDDKNQYLFSDDAIGLKLKLSVKPDDSYEMLENFEAVSIIVNVVDGFNVYSASDLSVIDNSTYTAWDSIKEATGLVGVNPTAVIFQNNIKITEKDIPESYMYTLNDIKYYNSGDKQTPAETYETRKYLYEKMTDEDYDYDFVYIFNRTVLVNEKFSIYGNYFSLDYSALPLVASFGGYDYGSDFSNATLIRIAGQHAEEGENMSSCYFENLNVIGNANRSELVDEQDMPVYAGGAIFFRMVDSDVKLNNVLMRTCMIALFGEDDGVNDTLITAEKVKCYDSYQSAIYMWGGVNLTLKDSNFERAGGPLSILTHVEPNVNTAKRIPTLSAENSTMISYVTGKEIWFKSIPGSETIVINVIGLDSAFSEMNKCIVTKDNGKNVINIAALVMSDGTDMGVVSNLQTQGSISITDKSGKNSYLTRKNTDAQFTQTLQGLYAQAGAGGGALPPVFSVNASTLVYFDGTTLQKVLGEYTDFATSDYLGLNYQGIAVMLGFYNK